MRRTVLNATTRISVTQCVAKAAHSKRFPISRRARRVRIALRVLDEMSSRRMFARTSSSVCCSDAMIVANDAEMPDCLDLDWLRPKTERNPYALRVAGFLQSALLSLP